MKPLAEMAMQDAVHRPAGRPPCHRDPFAREPDSRGGTRWVCYQGCHHRREHALRVWLRRYARELGWT